MAYYSIRGKVVAFVCNRGNANWTVFPQNLADSLSTITSRCGWYIAGAQQNGNDDKALLLGYQRWNGNVSTISADDWELSELTGRQDDFCGGARSSPANHC